MSEPLLVVPTGTANLASVMAAFGRIGLSPSVGGGSAAVGAARRVVMPGVGNFGAAAAEVERQGVREALIRRVEDDRPTLAICVGMQLLAESSEESPEAGGLGAIPAKVRRFDGAVRVPQMGWNTVSPMAGAALVEPGWAYFANSYRIDEIPDGWAGATTVYGDSFVSALERGNLLACQFHPELSGGWGLELLRRWSEL